MRRTRRYSPSSTGPRILPTSEIAIMAAADVTTLVTPVKPTFRSSGCTEMRGVLRPDCFGAQRSGGVSSSATSSRSGIMAWRIALAAESGGCDGQSSARCGRRNDFAAFAAANLVAPAARAANRMVVREQPNSAEARPSDLARWHAGDEGVVRHVGRDHRARRDESECAHCFPAYNRGIRAERGAAFHQRPFVFVFAYDEAARVADVRENHRRPAKDVVLELDSRIDGNIVLNFHVVSDLHV